MKPKYAIIPDWSYCKDGDRHWISVNRLMKLYSVDPRECILFKDTEEWDRLKHLYYRLTPLTVDQTGAYRLNQISIYYHPITDKIYEVEKQVDFGKVINEYYVLTTDTDMFKMISLEGFEYMGDL